MARPALLLLCAGLIVLTGCLSPFPAAPAPAGVPPATTAAPAVAVTATPAASAQPPVGTTAAPSPTLRPTAAPATAQPPATTPPTAAPAASAQPRVATTAAGSPRPVPTVPPGFTTHRDPEAGFAVDYPANWSITVPPAEARRTALAYTASIRSISLNSLQPRGQALPPGETGIDVTVYRTKATTFDEAVRERRAEILNSEMASTITSEEFVTLAGGLRAVRWQIETSQTGTVAELTTLLGTNRIMVDGMGNLAQFDAIASSLRAERTPSAGEANPTAAPDTGVTYTDTRLGFALAVPAGWELCQDTGWSRLFCAEQPLLAPPAGPSFPRFYVTALPAGFKNEDYSAYNFISEEQVKALMALPTGQSFDTNNPLGYGTFTRLPDTTVSGQPAAVIENAKVWEGGPNTKDRRVLVKVVTSTYMFGTYYETPAQLAEFERVLAGVAITAR